MGWGDIFGLKTTEVAKAGLKSWSRITGEMGEHRLAGFVQSSL